MPFDGPDFFDIVFFAERASGLKLRNLPSHRLRAADVGGGCPSRTLLISSALRQLQRTRHLRPARVSRGLRPSVGH